MSPVGISVAFAVAFGLFLWLAWRKLAIVVALQPEPRWDAPLERAKRVVVKASCSRACCTATSSRD